MHAFFDCFTWRFYLVMCVCVFFLPWGILKLFPGFVYCGCCPRILRNSNNLVFVFFPLQFSVHTNSRPMQNSPSLMQVGNNETSLILWDGNMKNGGSGQAQSIIYSSKVVITIFLKMHAKFYNFLCTSFQRCMLFLAGLFLLNIFLMSKFRDEVEQTNFPMI